MTIESLTVLTSRRSYEFAPDHVRLSLLTSQVIIDQIHQAFQFRASAVAQPQATFGPVPITLPPGLVFNIGVWLSPNGEIVPIRLLHFEPRRIVLDVAAPSRFIDGVYEFLQQILADYRAADGTPSVSDQYTILNYSEITARLSFSADAFLPSPVRNAIHRALSHDDAGNESGILPVLHALPVQGGAEIIGTPTQDSLTFTLTPRAGTQVADRVLFSSAPLDSDAHQAYLTSLDEALSWSC